MKANSPNWKLKISYIIAATVLVSIMIAAFMVSPQNHYSFWMSLMLLIAGITAGWIVGIVMSPYTQGEKTKFDSYTKAVASFLSGYVVAHLNDLIKHIVSVDFLRFHLFQLILIFVGFCVSVVMVYYTRQYA